MAGQRPSAEGLKSIRFRRSWLQDADARIEQFPASSSRHLFGNKRSRAGGRRRGRSMNSGASFQVDVLPRAHAAHFYFDDLVLREQEVDAAGRGMQVFPSRSASSCLSSRWLGSAGVAGPFAPGSRSEKNGERPRGRPPPIPPAPNLLNSCRSSRSRRCQGSARAGH
jgi:hypothetical protein